MVVNTENINCMGESGTGEIIAPTLTPIKDET